MVKKLIQICKDMEWALSTIQNDKKANPNL